jgi:hypothetical protein
MWHTKYHVALHTSFVFTSDLRKERNPIMATVRALDSAIAVEPRSGLPGRSFLARLAIYWSAIREGGAACQAYNQLVLNGTPHDEAVQRVFKEHFSRR